MATIEQVAAILDISFVPGDSFSFAMTFPFAITSYTIVAKIGSLSLTVAKTTSTKIVLSLTPEQSLTAKDGAVFYVKLDDRTYTKGKFTKK
jgi:hypothetical protein